MSPDPDELLGQRLWSGLSATALPVSRQAQRKLIAYIRLLAQWNKVYNLTAVRDPQAMVTRHLLDCLVLLPYLRGDRMVDLGSGGGLPGLVLAMARPEHQWVLLESRLKKARFLTQALIELKLDNVSVARERLETYQAPVVFSTFTARGLGTLLQVFAKARALSNSGSRSQVEREDDERATRHTEAGRRGASEEDDKVIRMKWKRNKGPASLLVMKGVYPSAELAELKKFYPNPEVHRLTVPELPAERHVVVMRLPGSHR